MSALAVSDLDAGYEDFQALFGVSLEWPSGETVALVGANGAGKTTLLMAIAGALRPWRGGITLDGDRHHRPARLPAGPAAWCWCRRAGGCSGSLTAEENILVPAAAGRRAHGRWSAIYELFPMVASAALAAGGAAVRR